MPDGGATEAVIIEEIAAETAATTVADGAAAAATAGADAAAVAAGEAGAASLALEGAGELAEVPALTSATGDTLATGASRGIATSEITGAGPAAQTGEAVTTSNTDKLAQQILQPTGPQMPPAQADVSVDKSGMGGKGIVDGMVNWADKHPMAATIAGTQIAGAVGGVGKAALEKEMAERNIRARSDLLTQQSATQLQQSRAGAVPGGGVAVKPRPGMLRRPDGTMVFAPTGIINSNIQGG